MIHDFAIYIRDLAVFLIFTTFALAVIPDSKYKSYIKLTLGFVMIFLILQPINSFLGNSNERSLNDIVDEFTTRITIDGAYTEKIQYDETQNELILETYKSSIKDQIKSLVNKSGDFSYIDSSISVCETEDNFGEILDIYIEVSDKPEAFSNITPTAKPFIRIEPVEINKKDIFSTKYDPDADKKDNGDYAELKNLKNLFSDFYNLSIDNIHITVQKKN